MSKFEEYLKDNYFSDDNPLDDNRYLIKNGWDACKYEVLNIIYRNSPLANMIPQPEFSNLEKIIKEITNL